MEETKLVDEKQLEDKLFIKILIVINLILALSCGIGEGVQAFVIVPLLLLSNLIIFIYALVKKRNKLATVAGILFFMAPIIGFSMCASVFKLDVR